MNYLYLASQRLASAEGNVENEENRKALREEALILALLAIAQEIHIANQLAHGVDEWSSHQRQGQDE